MSERARSILIVDDEPLVLRTVKTIVERAGFEAVTAADGQAALEICGRRPTIGLVLTDVKMPGMDGIELARSVGEKHPGIPVLLMTGFANGYPNLNAEIRRAANVSRLEVVFKPFTPSQLLAKIQGLLA
jgi:CheY-like chemotaxis protein